MSQPSTKVQDFSKPNPELYEIRVEANHDGPGVKVIIDGEVSSSDGFEFAAPLGPGGITIRRITRVELVAPDQPERFR